MFSFVVIVIVMWDIRYVLSLSPASVGQFVRSRPMVTVLVKLKRLHGREVKKETE